MEPEMHELAKLFPSIAAQLRSSLGTLYLAATQMVTVEQREADPVLDAKAAILDQSYYQMLRMVNNLNQTALLHSEKPLQLRDTDLVVLLRDLCARVEALAAELGLTLEFVCREQQLICAAAPKEFEQMVFHLLSNAFKFTHAGGKITVELQLLGKQVQMSVIDTGTGIPPEKLETLFDRYLHENLMDPGPTAWGWVCPCADVSQRGTAACCWQNPRWEWAAVLRSVCPSGERRTVPCRISRWSTVVALALRYWHWQMPCRPEYSACGINKNVVARDHSRAMFLFSFSEK